MSTFRFHKFENESEPMGFRKTNLSNNFNSYSSMNNTNPFNNNSSNEILKNTINTILQRQLNLYKYPYKENSSISNKDIIKYNFEKILNKYDLDIIEKILPTMVFKIFNRKENTRDFVFLIPFFQKLLKYLFQCQEEIKKLNSFLENNIDDQEEKQLDLNNRKLENENIIKKNNDNKINIMLKINKYKDFLIETGNENLIPREIFLITNNNNKIKKQGIFNCDLCDKTFNSYDKIHEHYIKKHLNLYKLKEGNLISSNTYFQKMNFDHQLNLLKSNLYKTIYNIKNTNKNGNDQKMKELKKEIENLQKKNEENNLVLKSFKKPNNKTIQINQNINQSILRQSFMNSSNPVLDEKFKTIKNQQNKRFNDLQNEFNDFQFALFQQLKNLSNNKEIKEPEYKEIQENINNEFNQKNNEEITKNESIIGKSYIQESILDSNHSTRNYLKNTNPNSNSPNPFELIIEKEEDIEDKGNASSKIRITNSILKSSFIPIEPIKERNKVDILYNKYYFREKNILLSSKNYDIIQKKIKKYNFLDLQPSDEIKTKIQKQIKDKCKDYNFDDNIKNELLEKDDYENIIKKIFEFNIQESKSKKDYGRYKDNSYKMNEIEFMIDSIFDDDIKRVIYGDLDIDLIYNFYSTQLI